MASNDGNPEELRIVLVGESGSGKSATGNTILRKRAFTIGQSWDPETLTCQRERSEFEGTPVVVVDTPCTTEINAIEMFKCISYCALGIHAFLLVISPYQHTDVKQNVKTLQRWFGKEVLDYIIVLITHGDKPVRVTFSQTPFPYGVGYRIFNNRDGDPSQVRELLEKIHTMTKRNGGSNCIKVKDWKHMCLYVLASAVTTGAGIGAASGGTAGGVVLAVVGSAVGAVAAADGGNRAVAACIAGAAAVGLAVAIGAGVGTGAEFALKATAAIVAGAFVDGAAFKGCAHIVHECGLFGIVGGAAVGAGASATYIETGLGLFLSYVVAVVGAFTILIASMTIFIESYTAFSRIAGCAVVAAMSAGAAFGAAGGVLGASGFAAGVMISVACQSVTWWLNIKD